MRKRIVLFLLLPLCLCGCERETLTDPVLFCKGYNRVSGEPIAEADAYLRSENEVLLFSDGTIIRLRLNEDGAIHTAIVTGEVSHQTASVCENAFMVLAQPFSESVPQEVRALFGAKELTVQTDRTKRFYYAVFCDGQNVTAVQTNLLLSAIPVLPALRPEESE